MINKHLFLFFSGKPKYYVGPYQSLSSQPPNDQPTKPGNNIISYVPNTISN